MSFIFGGNTGLTYEEAKRKREIADSLTRGNNRAPQNVGEGLNAIGQALMARGLRKKADKADKEGRSRADSAFAAVLGGRKMGQPASGGSYQPPSGDNAAAVRAGLISRGMPEHIADGFVMNFKDESGLKTDINEHAPIVPGSRGGYGLAQWTGPRRKQLEAFAQSQNKPVSDMDVQLDFLMTELQGSEARAAKSIFSAKDAGSAATAIVNDFLRPAEEHRASRSQRYMGAGGGRPQQPAQVAGGGPGVEEIMAAMSDPYMSDQQKQALGILLEQKMQANDPMRKLQMQKAQIELDRLQNPEPKVPEFKIEELSDGRKYYVDPTGQQPARLVNPDAPEPGPDPKAEQDLRKEFSGLPANKDFSAQSQAFGRIIASTDNPSPAGDLALIFNYMKLLDPGSVVRESEFATAAASGSYGERIRAAVNKINTGERLSEEMRQDFLKRSEMLYNEAERGFDNLYGQYADRAKGYGMSPEAGLNDFRYKGQHAPEATQRPQLRPESPQAVQNPQPAPQQPDAGFEAFAADPSAQAAAEKYGVTIEEMWEVKRGLKQ
jgi:hypothetical protein